MNIRKYIKNVIYNLINDERGQLDWYILKAIGEARKKAQEPKRTPSYAQSLLPVSGYTPTSTYKGGGGSVSPTYKSDYGGSVSPTYQYPKRYTPSQQKQQQPVTPATSQAPALSAALGYQYQPYNMPEFNVPQYNVNLPTIDWGFAPTEAQRGDWQTQATATAAQEIDPQLQAIQAALQQYMTQGQVQRAELNPRYTSQSLAIANIIQNTVKQEAIDQAIRRGAETSGWLPSALMEAGQLETEQRGQVETQRSQELAALAALETQQTRAAGEQETMLEGLRGQRTTSALAELESQAWARSQQEKESQWQSALGGEQLRASAYGGYAQNMLGAYQTQAGVGMSNADRQLQAAIAAAEQGNVQWQQQYTTSQDAYQRQLAAAQQAQAGVEKEPLGYEEGIPYYSVSELDTIRRTYGLGPYAPEKTPSNTLSNLQDQLANYMQMYETTTNESYLRQAEAILRKINEYTQGPAKIGQGY